MKRLSQISKPMIVFYTLVVIGCWWSIRWLERPRHENWLGSPKVQAIQQYDEEVQRTVSALWARIEAGLRKQGSSHADRLNPPISAEGLSELERNLGYRLPGDLRASLLVHNGTRGEFVANYGLYGGGRIDGTWDMIVSDGLEYPQPLLEPDPKVVERYWWHPGWIPVGGWQVYEMFINMETGEVFQHNEASGVWQTASWTRWLENVALRLESGEFRLMPGKRADWTNAFTYDTPGSEGSGTESD